MGAMTQGLGRDAPLETFFVQVDDTRFIVLRPTPEIVGKARSVHVYALNPNFADPAKSRVGKTVVFDKMGMGVMPIFPSELDAWSHLTRVVLYPYNSNADPLAYIVFDPPLPIESRFKKSPSPDWRQCPWKNSLFLCASSLICSTPWNLSSGRWPPWASWAAWIQENSLKAALPALWQPHFQALKAPYENKPLPFFCILSL